MSEKDINNEEEMMEADIITLLDDDENEYEFEVLDEIDYKESGSTYMIFEAVEDENGESQLAEVEDDDLLDEIAEVFEERFDQEMDEE